jgi:hypothetical protein
MLSSSTLDPTRFLRNHLLLHTKRADCALPLPACCPARTSPPRCFRRLRAVSRARLLLVALLRTIAMHRLLLLASRVPCAQPLLRIFPQLRCSAFSFSPRALRARNRCCEFFHLPPPSASQAKRRCVQRPCLPTAAALLVLKEMGLHRNLQTVVAHNRRPRVETAIP